MRCAGFPMMMAALRAQSLSGARRRRARDEPRSITTSGGSREYTEVVATMTGSAERGLPRTTAVRRAQSLCGAWRRRARDEPSSIRTSGGSREHAEVLATMTGSARDRERGAPVAASQRWWWHGKRGRCAAQGAGGLEMIQARSERVADRGGTPRRLRAVEVAQREVAHR